jgi:hypothetical protein
MPTYDVTVHLALCKGYTAADAEVDSDAVLGDHIIPVAADSPAQAEELALDEFHRTVPVGNLEAVDGSARAKEGRP